MGKYFGTDGIRGVANTELTIELTMKLGRVLGANLVKEHDKPKVLIGRDTRISGEMLEGALIAGLVSSGASVMKLGVISTPGVAYLTKNLDVQAGIMISASHNPVEDNGIKIFQGDGYKLKDAIELEIEALIDAEDELPRPVGGAIGTVESFKMGAGKYLNFLKSTIDNDLSGFKIALDPGHGAASALARQLFSDLGAEIVEIGANPDGLNINDNVGSTHPEALQAVVTAEGADFGFAFDGDADRLIAVDNKGEIVDGDHIMFILGRHLHAVGKLKDGVIVSTVMSNLGFYKSVEAANLKSVATKVGDRYVLEEMLAHGYTLGGEQSGHIIMLEHASTGDGLLSAIQLASVIKKSDKALADLAADMPKFPQLLQNMRVIDKVAIQKNPEVLAKIAEVEEKMAGNGRVLVRASGTEQLLRVMVEAETDELCQKYVTEIVEVAKKVDV
ncbi:MAG: phosphoglucosamine mutase [Turicibacter sp.]|nr:phosphoglucosamine mutase [Turicibacter sp.]